MALLGKVRNAKDRTTLVAMLVAIAAQAGGLLVPLTEAEKVHKADNTLITFDAATKNAEGDVLAKITEAGAKALGEHAAQPEKVAATPAPKQTFEIHTASEIPASKRGGNFSARYPFDQLAVKQYFFVPEAEGKNPAKLLASTVNSANKRYKDKADGQDGQSRKFVVRVYEHNGQKGAAVFRVN